MRRVSQPAQGDCAEWLNRRTKYHGRSGTAIGVGPTNTSLRRRLAARDRAHPHLLLEARFDEHRMAAEVMLAAVRALPSLRPGACSLFDVPPRALFRAAVAERDWISAPTFRKSVLAGRSRNLLFSRGSRGEGSGVMATIGVETRREQLLSSWELGMRRVPERSCSWD